MAQDALLTRARITWRLVRVGDIIHAADNRPWLVTCVNNDRVTALRGDEGSQTKEYTSRVDPESLVGVYLSFDDARATELLTEQLGAVLVERDGAAA